MPVYLSDSYKLASVRVYPNGVESFEVENVNPDTGKRFSNKDFLQYVDTVLFKKYGFVPC